METNEEYVKSLIFMTRTYEGITKQISSAKNRTQSLMKEKSLKHDAVISEMESVKGKIDRRIGKELIFYPIWNEWLKQVPGIGFTTAAKLIILYYFRSVPVCQDCGTDLVKDDGFWCPTCEKSVKGEGNLQFRIEERDFPRISSWWKFLGMHNTEHCPVCRLRVKQVEKDADGKEWHCQITKGKDGKKRGCDQMFSQDEVIFLKPKRQAGVQSDWSTPGRTVGHMIGESFNKQGKDHKYRAYAEREKLKYAKRNPDWTKGHVHNSAWNNAAKLFLSHFWQVARTLDDKEMTKPYICQKNPAHNIIPPFYYDGEIKDAA